MKTKKLLIAILVAISFLALSLGTQMTVVEEDIVVEEPLEIEDWMTEPFVIAK